MILRPMGKAPGPQFQRAKARPVNPIQTKGYLHTFKGMVLRAEEITAAGAGQGRLVTALDWEAGCYRASGFSSYSASVNLCPHQNRFAGYPAGRIEALV